jgi:hypothetical protein
MKYFNASKFVVLGLVMLTGLQARAFNYRRCMDRGIGNAYFGGQLTSTTQFSSSWGPCTMIGAAPLEQRRLFIASTIDSIKLDSARGGGEYLTTMASLYGCDKNGALDFGPIVQRHYLEIFGEEGENSPEYVRTQVEGLIRRVPSLKSCEADS